MAGTKPNTGETQVWRIVQSVRELFEGRSDAIGQVTLTVSSATTTVNDNNVGPYSVVKLSPRTANAAAAIGGLYVSSIKAKQFVLTHANNAQADRTFDYALQG